jgi:PST family polysaccharide transporter
LGLDGIVVRELVKNPNRRDEYLGSAFGLKLAGGVLGFLIVMMTISFLRSGDSLTIWMVGLSASGFLFQSLNVIDFYFQSKVESKYTVIAANVSFFLVTLAKVTLLLCHARLLAFGIIGLIEVVLTSLFLVIAYRHNGLNIRNWSFKQKIAFELLRDSWPLILTSFAIMIYMRIDQVMISQMLGNYALGIFSAAIRISEIWYFIPMIIASSIFPALVLSKESDESLYYQRLQKISDYLAIFGLGIAFSITFLSPFIIHFLYGPFYESSASVLSLHVWAGVFVALGVVSGSWFVAENMQKYAFYRALSGAIINILLNLIMIPAYGPKGAAISTIISQACASVIFNAFNKKTRKIFYMQIKSLTLTRIFSTIFT